ncbi:MAG: phosphoadenylyl-sulfate reductase [Burkholderiaceae bacterium]
MSATELHAHPSADFETKLAESRLVLQQAAFNYQVGSPETTEITQASSLGAEDVVITHMANTLDLGLPLFVLDTGMLHPQTLQLLRKTVLANPARVSVFTPITEATISFVSQHGKDAMYQSVELRKSCCHIRKVEPLERALAGKKAWITGLRREQSNARAEVPLIDDSAPRIKINPLANWTWGDVWHYIQLHAVPYNPLHDEFFPSIGCAPCTRAIALGEDFRAGRWWWEDPSSGGSAKECGLHVKDDLLPGQMDPSDPVFGWAETAMSELKA